MREDLAWWWHILRDSALNSVPLNFIAALPQPDFTITTDASDDGICALLPALHSALTYRFSPFERQEIAEFKAGAKNAFDINYRELLACAFAVQEWAPALRRARPQASLVHVHFRIDNTSAVAWQSKMASRNPRAQTLIRLLGFGLGSASPPRIFEASRTSQPMMGLANGRNCASHPYFVS
jgi:hypothetical protein